MKKKYQRKQQQTVLKHLIYQRNVFINEKRKDVLFRRIKLTGADVFFILHHLFHHKTIEFGFGRYEELSSP